MKRLTKDERTGATAIALVALLICGGSFLWSRRDRDSEKSEEIVRSVILASDSTENDNLSGNEFGEATETHRNKRERKRTSHPANKKEKTKKSKTEKTDKKNKKDSSPSRDFLSDPL